MKSQIKLINILNDDKLDKTMFSNSYYNILYDNNLLYEMLNSSISFNLLTKEILKIVNIETKFINNEYQFILNLTKPFVPIYNRIKERLNTFNWFISIIYINGKYLKPNEFINNLNDELVINEQIILKIEPKFDIKIDSNKIESLFHISFDIFNNSIMSKGLIPKSKYKISNHPNRIYFVLNPSNENIIIHLAKKLYLTYKNKTNIKDIYIYKIKNDSLDKHSFYNDCNYKDGVYSNEMISKEHIEIYKIIPVK